MKTIICISLIFFCPTLFAQYYYKDFISNKETNALNKTMKQAKVTHVKVKSLDFDNSEIENFLCEQSLENNCKTMVTITGSPFIGENHLHSFLNNISLITRSVDSNNTNSTLIIQNNYEYLPNNNLKQITVTTIEPEARNRVTETHQWFYNAINLPEKMLVVKNGNDTTTVLFKIDTVQHLVTDEIIYKKGIEKERYYYYYDANKQMTDIVRYHPYKKKLLPELILEYNTKGELFKKTSFTTGSKDYQVWMYQYNDKGLKIEDQCYVQGVMFRGKLVYTYSYE
jgi:hypothetical protein